MATLNVNTTAYDGFYNNISGPYDSEDFNVASTSSSSDANTNHAIMFFDTRSSTHSELVGATINSITLKFWCSSKSDVNVVGVWYFYHDPTNHWGDNITSAYFSSGYPTYGTYNETPNWNVGNFTTGAWNTKTLTADQNILTYGCRVAIVCGASDIGPAEMYFRTVETTGSYDPYVVLDYSPAVIVGASPLQLMMGG